MVVIDRGWAKQHQQTKASYMPPVQTHALTNTQALLQTLNKTNRHAGFHYGAHYSYKSHTRLCEFTRKFWRRAGTRSPAAELTFAFIARLAARKGQDDGPNRYRPWEPLPQWCKTSQPLAPVAGTAFPMDAQQRLQDVSCCQGGHLQWGEWGCAWGQELRRGVVRQGHGTNSTDNRAPYTLGTRHKH